MDLVSPQLSETNPAPRVREVLEVTGLGSMLDISPRVLLVEAARLLPAGCQNAVPSMLNPLFSGLKLLPNDEHNEGGITHEVRAFLLRDDQDRRHRP